MNEYLKIANHPLLYGVVILLLLLIFGQAAYYIRMALIRAKELGIGRDRLKAAVKTAAVTSVVPSIAIIIALMTLTPVIGLPISWGRLSVIGSLSYELLAANIGAEASGAVLGGAGYDGSALLTSVCAMTAGSFASLSLTFFFFKGYKKRLNRSLAKNKDSGWGSILMATIIVSMYARFMAEPVATGGVSLVTMLISALCMVGFGIFIKKTKINWLKDFAVSFSMIIAMAAVVLIYL